MNKSIILYFLNPEPVAFNDLTLGFSAHISPITITHVRPFFPYRQLATDQLDHILQGFMNIQMHGTCDT